MHMQSLARPYDSIGPLEFGRFDETNVAQAGLFDDSLGTRVHQDALRVLHDRKEIGTVVSRLINPYAVLKGRVPDKSTCVAFPQLNNPEALCTGPAVPVTTNSQSLGSSNRRLPRGSLSISTDRTSKPVSPSSRNTSSACCVITTSLNIVVEKSVTFQEATSRTSMPRVLRADKTFPIVPTSDFDKLPRITYLKFVRHHRSGSRLLAHTF